MGVVFAVLVLLQITIRALGAFDRVPAPAEAAPSPGPEAAPPVAAEDSAPRIAAAIGVALAMAEEEKRWSPSAPATGEHATAGWVQAGRTRQISSRTAGRERRGS